MHPAGRRVAWIVAAIALGYSTLHFATSGVRAPLDQPNLSKFEEETGDLRAHMQTGLPLRANPAQWGPVFLMIIEPILRGTGGLNDQLARWLYAIQIVCLVIAFLLTCMTLRPLVPDGAREDWPLLVAALVVVWLNFAPLYMVLAVKTVETWEVLLLAAALGAHLQGHRWLVAVALAAAGLIKVLPFVFFYYLLVTDRRTFVYACAALAGFLVVGQLLYGSDLGFNYLPRIAQASMGHSYLVEWHENLSLKGALVKLFGHLDPPSSHAYAQVGYIVQLTPTRLRIATWAGDALAVAGMAWLTWTWLGAGLNRTSARVVWEWSLLLAVMLILSPHTAFEYITLAIGAISYAVVRIATAPQPGRRPWLPFAGSLLLLGVLLPRPILNRVTFVTALNRWTGYTHFTPSEAFQYYCLPLIGLLLLAWTIWRLKPAAFEPA